METPAKHVFADIIHTIAKGNIKFHRLKEEKFQWKKCLKITTNSKSNIT